MIICYRYNALTRILAAELNYIVFADGRALSASEVAANHEIDKERFGLP